MLKKRDALFAFTGSFIVILALALLDKHAGPAFLMAPFGASCVLVFAARSSPFARARNIAAGYLISAVIGFAALKLLGPSVWSVALGCGLAAGIMALTGTIHPPAGSLPILIILSGASWRFLLFPTASGVALLCVLSFVLNRFVFRLRD
jgi:CBS-domain-containing membrane protein